MNDFTVRTPLQLGSILKGFRLNQGLSQQMVGAKVGLAQKAVSKIELDPGSAGFIRIFMVLGALDLELVVRPRGKVAHKSEW